MPSPCTAAGLEHAPQKLFAANKSASGGVASLFGFGGSSSVRPASAPWDAGPPIACVCAQTSAQSSEGFTKGTMMLMHEVPDNHRLSDEVHGRTGDGSRSMAA
jgi:hypothetical protein